MCQKDWEEGRYQQGECWMLTVAAEVQGRLLRVRRTNMGGRRKGEGESVREETKAKGNFLRLLSSSLSSFLSSGYTLT